MFSHIRKRLNIISRKLKEIFSERIVSIIVFGSRVRDDYVVVKNKELKKRYRGIHVWARGYFVSTVGIDEKTINK